MENKNQFVNKLYPALFAIQKEIENIKKDAKNPYYNSTYATLEAVLEAVKPLLNKHGILLIQKCDGNKLTTCLIHSETGEEIKSSLDLINIPDMQKLGSAVTYARRYSLQSILAIGSEDDDANATIYEYKNKDIKRDPSKINQPIHEPFGQRFATYAFCSQCFGPMYLSKKGDRLYCSNWKDSSIQHDSAKYLNQDQLPDNINTYEKWMEYKKTIDIPF